MQSLSSSFQFAFFKSCKDKYEGHLLEKVSCHQNQCPVLNIKMYNTQWKNNRNYASVVISSYFQKLSNVKELSEPEVVILNQNKTKLFSIFISEIVLAFSNYGKYGQKSIKQKVV